MDTTDTSLPQILSYYPEACIGLDIYAVIIWGFSFLGVLITLYQVFFKHGKFNFYYLVQFFVAGAVSCRYYDLFDDMDSTLPLIMVSPIRAAFTMGFDLLLPVVIMTITGRLITRFIPQESLFLGNPAVKKMFRDLWRSWTKKQNQSHGKISRQIGQRLAIIIGDQDFKTDKIKSILEKEMFLVIEAYNGADGLSMAAFNYPDLVVLNPELSDIESSVVLSRLREWTEAPALIMNTTIDENDIADTATMDNNFYLSKNFSDADLKDNISSILRNLHHNSQQRDHSVFQTNIFQLDQGTRSLTIRKKEVHLTPHEFHILSYLTNHAGQVVTLKMIHEEFWGKHMDEDSLRHYIHKLRYKIELDPVLPKYILTEPGLGYRLNHR